MEEKTLSDAQLEQVTGGTECAGYNSVVIHLDKKPEINFDVPTVDIRTTLTVSPSITAKK